MKQMSGAETLVKISNAQDDQHTTNSNRWCFPFTPALWAVSVKQPDGFSSSQPLAAPLLGAAARRGRTSRVLCNTFLKACANAAEPQRAEWRGRKGRGVLALGTGVYNSKQKQRFRRHEKAKLKAQKIPKIYGNTKARPKTKQTYPYPHMSKQAERNTTQTRRRAPKPPKTNPQTKRPLWNLGSAPTKALLSSDGS